MEGHIQYIVYQDFCFNIKRFRVLFHCILHSEVRDMMPEGKECTNAPSSSSFVPGAYAGNYKTRTRSFWDTFISK